MGAPSIREEVLFGDRRVRCFQPRHQNLQAILAETFSRFADREAYVCDAQRLTWREAEELSARLAASWQRHGVNPGDRVALFMGNSTGFAAACLAAIRLGAIAVPMGVRMQSEEIAHVINDSGAVLIVHDEELANRLPPAESVPLLRIRMAFDESALEGELSGSVAFHAAAQEDPAFLLYTSGTTGRPKGAVLTHVNVVHSVMHFQMALALDANECSVAAVPLSHVTGLVAQLLSMLFCGGKLVMMPKFQALEFLALAEHERMTHTVMVPAMYTLCVMSPQWPAATLQHWRVAAYGGAPMPVAVIEKLRAALPRLCLVNAYGATETCSPTTVMPLSGGPADSVGKPVACADLMVVNPETGKPQPSNHHGELWIRGPMVVPSYWNNPEASRAAFIDGWWRSGDIASLAPDGFVRIHDRLKDMINRGGYKVFSAEVENVLMTHPGVSEAAVVGFPCPVLGERVGAFVTADPGTDEANLRSYCASKLSDYKVPERIEVSAQPLPRNHNGKIEKKVLRETAKRYWAGHA
jgi:long-chain acyl-CoA synthetase